jgi:DNA (cytosine-5)-methyltransferase 1
MSAAARKQLRVADVFCGIGSFHIAAEELGMRCVWACDNDPHVQKVYQAQFGIVPDGDIQTVRPVSVPDHDILAAGFPCQPFSRMGNKRGSNEERGRVVDYVVDILRVKRPGAVILENVRGFLTSNDREDFNRLKTMVEAAGYSFQHGILKCEDFGIPQTRHRVFMICFRDGHPPGFQYPNPLGDCPTLANFLGLPVVKRFSNTIRCSGRRSGVDNPKNWSAYKLENGEVFEYTIAHVTKLQGFPEDFRWSGVPESQRWKMLGNTIPTCLSKAILKAVGDHITSVPEMAAKALPLVAHLPPARKLIEKRLDDCEMRARQLMASASIQEEEEEEGDDDGEDDGTAHEEAEQETTLLCNTDSTSSRGSDSSSPSTSSASSGAKKRPSEAPANVAPAAKKQRMTQPSIVQQLLQASMKVAEKLPRSLPQSATMPIGSIRRTVHTPPLPVQAAPVVSLPAPLPSDSAAVSMRESAPSKTAASPSACSAGPLVPQPLPYAMELTLKSGADLSMFCWSLPEGATEQRVMLRIVR